jgi:putative transcriptional regulator
VIETRLDRLLLEQKMTLTDLAGRVGITVANLSILKTGKARAVRIATLDAICRELHCHPGDILVHRDDSDLHPAPQTTGTAASGRDDE